MKTIKDWILRFISVIYYNIYLMGKLTGNEINTLPSLTLYISLYIMSIILPLLPFVNDKLLGNMINDNLVFLVDLLFFIMIYFASSKLMSIIMKKNNNCEKIIKQKPKFFKNQVLSMIITLLFSIGSFVALGFTGYFMYKLNK